MDNTIIPSQIVRLYQSDYEKLKKIADENQISLAAVISNIISNYERMTAGPQMNGWTVQFANGEQQFTN